MSQKFSQSAKQGTFVAKYRREVVVNSYLSWSFLTTPTCIYPKDIELKDFM